MKNLRFLLLLISLPTLAQLPCYSSDKIDKILWPENGEEFYYDESVILFRITLIPETEFTNTQNTEIPQFTMSEKCLSRKQKDRLIYLLEYGDRIEEVKKIGIDYAKRLSTSQAKEIAKDDTLKFRILKDSLMKVILKKFATQKVFYDNIYGRAKIVGFINFKEAIPTLEYLLNNDSLKRYTDVGKYYIRLALARMRVKPYYTEMMKFYTKFNIEQIFLPYIIKRDSVNYSKSDSVRNNREIFADLKYINTEESWQIIENKLKGPNYFTYKGFTVDGNEPPFYDKYRVFELFRKNYPNVKPIHVDYLNYSIRCMTNPDLKKVEDCYANQWFYEELKKRNLGPKDYVIPFV